MAGSDVSPEISPAVAPRPQTPPATAPKSEAVPETVEAPPPPPPQTPPALEAPESESPTAEEPVAPESVEAAEVTAPETSPVAEEPAAPESVEAAEVTESETAPAVVPVVENAAAAALAASSESEEILITADSPDNKRKLEDLVDGAAASKSAEKAPESVSPLPSASADPSTPKRQRLDGESALAGEEEMQKIEAPVLANGQPSAVENDPVLNNSFYQQGSVTCEQKQASSETTSRKFEIPNNKVGVLIGKSGETIRVLQENSGAKIQITRDNEADSNTSYRPVELIGTLECINKAEQLIKDVIAAAETGGSPALVARGFGYGQSGSEQHEMQVPNAKVGLVIGKGGETIKNLQLRSGARIQLIPQNLPEGESANDKIVRLTGNKKQIEDAKEMIKEVMNQAQVKRTHSSGGYNQQSFRPRGPSFGSQWGTRMPAPAQQRGMYPPQSAQYPPQSYGSYTQQHIPPRNSTSTAWDQRAGVPIQTAEYNNYYGQGGQGSDNQSIPAAALYGPSQSVGYGQHAPYVQSAQQSYNPGFTEQNYDGQARGQYYGQQPVNSQPGAYPQQSYGPPRPQSTDPMYQGSVQTSYGAGEPAQPFYYGQTAPTQPAPVYGQAYSQTPGTSNGYAQPSSTAGYPQQSSQVAPGYAQVGQPAPTYTQQTVQSGGYVQYPPQQGYGGQSAQNNVNYGYQPTEAVYGGNSIPGSGYGPSPVINQAGYGQTGYPQQQTYPTGYEQQSVPPQSGYGS